MIPAAFKCSKGHHDLSNRTTEFTHVTKTEFYMKNGGHFEKWAPYWNLKWLQNSEILFQQPLKHANRC